MGVRGIARWSNAPTDGVRLISESISKHHHARSAGLWKAELRTLKSHTYLSDGHGFGPERLLWEYSGMPDNILMIVEDVSAPKRADYLAAKAVVIAHNNAKKAAGAPESELQPEPVAPPHYRHSLISFRIPGIPEVMLGQLGGPWELKHPGTTGSMQQSGKGGGGVTHQLRIDGYVFNVGPDWNVRVARVLGPTEQFKGIIMEIEYLPMDNLPYIEGSSAFLDAFTMSLLPSLPSEANFNSVIITDQEWAHVCGVDLPSGSEVSDESLHVYGDEEELNVDDSHKDDWRRSAYMIVQAFRGEGIL